MHSSSDCSCCNCSAFLWFISSFAFLSNVLPASVNTLGSQSTTNCPTLHCDCPSTYLQSWCWTLWCRNNSEEFFVFFSFSQVGVTSLKQKNLSGRWRQQTRSPPRLQGVATGMQDSTSVSRMAKQVRGASFRRYTTTDTEATVSRVQGLLV